MRKTTAAMALLVLSATVLSGCALTDEAAGDDKSTVVAVTPLLTNLGLDIMKVESTPYRPVFDEIFDYPIEQDPSGALIPGLATDWSVSDDGLTWTFVFRDDVIFQNGDPLTAADAAWSYNRMMFDPESQQAISQYREITESITAEGNDLIVKTTTPLSTVPLWFAKTDGNLSGIVYPQKYFESVGADAFYKAPVGTGPFEYVSFEGEESAHLTAWLDDGRSDWQKTRTPGYTDLIIKAVPDASTAVAMLKAGEADIIPVPISSVSDVQASGFETQDVPGATFSVMWCIGATITPDSPCDDQDVREALSIAIDRDAIAQGLYQGFAEPSAAWVPGPGGFGYPSDLDPVQPDPDLAKELLANAGYGPDNPLKVQILTYDDDADFPMLSTMAEAMVGYYQSIGVEAEITVQEWGLQEARLAEHDYPGQAGNAAVTPVTLFMRGIDNRYHMVNRMVTELTDVGERGAALWNSSDPLAQEQTALLNEVLAEFDLDKQEVLFADYHKWLAEHWYQIPLLSANAVFATSDKIAGWDDRIAGKSQVHNLWSLEIVN
jgi:peptide/nickel transport system substrate-binding protein